jgi:hypothetical protein
MGFSRSREPSMLSRAIVAAVAGALVALASLPTWGDEPTTSSTPAAAPAEPKAILEDKPLREAGYKPQIIDGQRMWCRNATPPLGTRLTRAEQSCYTAEALKMQLKNGRELTERAQTNNQNLFNEVQR